MRLEVLVKFFSIHIAIFKTVYWNLNSQIIGTEIGIEIRFHELDL